MNKPETPSYSKKIINLLQGTMEVIQDCTLENGGIVAANSTQKHFPGSAKNYYYVWPRDAAFACLAADMMGNKELQGNFFAWCLDRAEDFRETGLFYEKYYPNGLKALMNFQPDQTGTVLFAASNFCRTASSGGAKARAHSLIKLAADGLCSVWNGTCFTKRAMDLWEERSCFPHLEENFTYSLAACIKGLSAAYEILGDQKWLETSESMKDRLDLHFDDIFVRSYGKLTDRRLDASMMGLVYPFDVYEATDYRIVSTIQEIVKNLVIDGGVHRYRNDEYDGWMHDGVHLNKGGGAWPLLNFWLSVYYSIKGDRVGAEKHFFGVLDKLGDDASYIPEQIFDNDIQVSVSPLLWSHVMFYLAVKHLKLI